MHVYRCPCRARRPTTDREKSRKPVVDEIELWWSDSELRCDPVRARAEHRVFRECERPCPEHPEESAVSVPVDARRCQERAEREEQARRHPTDQPADATERGGKQCYECGCLREVQRDGSRHDLRLSGVVLDEPAWRPVGFRSVAPTRAVQRRDVLKRDEDVPVELDMRDILERAVRGEDAFLVLAAEESDFDLLALVLVRVVVHEPQQ